VKRKRGEKKREKKKKMKRRKGREKRKKEEKKKRRRGRGRKKIEELQGNIFILFMVFLV
jgi:hypothetical protein